MKRLRVLIFCAAAPVYAAAPPADDAMSRMLDAKLTAAQRNNACYALRSTHTPETIAAMRGALGSEVVRACAARNLRESGAVEELKGALNAPEPEVRAIAARELGGFERPELIPLLMKAAQDSNMLVAVNAVMALGQYHDVAVVPYLLDLAAGSGAAGVAALSRAAELDEGATVGVARKLLRGNDVARKLLALKVLADCGNASDVPSLQEIAAKSGVIGTPSRGFGLMPPLDLSLAAKNAIEAIHRREGAHAHG